MPLLLEDVAYGVSAVVLFAFGAFVLYLAPRQRAVRALVLLLVASGLAFASNPLEALIPVEVQLMLGRWELLVYTTIGVSTIYFLSVYPRPRGWLGRSRYGAWAAGGVVAGVAIVLVTRPALAGAGRIVEGSVEWQGGPLGFIYSGWALTSAAIFLLLALDHRRIEAGPVRRSLALVLTGFVGGALAWHTSVLLNDVAGRVVLTSQRERVMYALEEIVFFPALAAAIIVVVHGLRSRDAAARRDAALIAAVALAAMGAATFATFAFAGPARPGVWSSTSQGVVDAMGALLVPAFAGYAILKHRLFDIDVKLRWTISRGAVAATFLAIFFVAAQLAQNFLSESYGWMLGGVIAGVMLFAIAPIQRIAERVAVAAIPVGTSGGDRSLEVYRLALALALSDRAITREEERHLARLAEELGLGHSEALAAREAMEREIGLAQ